MHSQPTRNAGRSVGAGGLGWLIPSVSDLLFLILLAALSYGALAPRLLGDAGIGWHIRNGQQMLHMHAVTRVDPFSSTMGGQAWYAWEWLYDLLIAGIHQFMGLNGVVFATALVIATTFAITFRATLERGANLMVAVLMLGFAVGASAIHLFARPHVLSWLLVVIWFQLVQSWETTPGPSKDRSLFWLPLSMLLWVNLHGGFLTGLMLLGVYLVNGLIRYVTAQEHGRRLIAGRRLRHLAVMTFLSFAATMVNPYGYKLHVHVFQYLSNRFLMNHIEEFLSPNFHGLGEQCFAALLVLTIIALAIERQRPRLSEGLVILFAVVTGLYASRSLPISSLLLVLVVAPVLSRAVAAERADVELASWLRNWLSRLEAFATRMVKMETSLHGHFWPIMAVLLGLWICLHGGTLGSRQVLDAHFSAPRFPVQAVAQIQQLGIPGPIFAPDYWGGYLIYELYPQTKVVLDDRHDLYGEQFFKNYLKEIRAEPGWEQILMSQRATWVLVPADSTLATGLKEKSGWVMRYEDPVAVLFQRSGD